MILSTIFKSFQEGKCLGHMGSLMLLLYFKGSVIKYHGPGKEKPRGQAIHTDDAETTLNTLSYLIFVKGATHIHWKKDIIFNKWC